MRCSAVAMLVLLALVIVGVIAVASSSSDGEAEWPSAERAALIATTPIDTGHLAEDEQPGYTRWLAMAGWDFNPDCDDVNDWYPVGHSCHTGHVTYPSGTTVGGGH